jgi:hypothetical protein
MNWQERLNEHEEIPPQDGWQHIRQTLEPEPGGLRKKMLAFEAEPPVDGWDRILRSISQRRIPSARLIPMFRRYAVTAGIAASLLLVVYVYLGSSDDLTNISAGLAPVVRKPSTTSPKVVAPPAKTPPQPTMPIASAPLPDAMPDLAQTTRQRPRSFKGRTDRSQQKTIPQDANYIELCDRTGECDRLTYKLEDWAACLHASCRDADGKRAKRARKIEAWRSRLEQSTYVPAAGHFFDIGEMAALLQSGEK